MYSPSMTIIPSPLSKPAVLLTTATLLVDVIGETSVGGVDGPLPTRFVAVIVPFTLMSAADAWTWEFPPARQKFPSVMIDVEMFPPPVPEQALMSPQL